LPYERAGFLSISRGDLVLERDLFDAGHHDFRVMVRDFVAKEVEPHT
jgi:hypothetical protein